MGGHQLAIPELGQQVVNVAQVKQLSPFRYPGGKTWLVPFVRRWLNSLSLERVPGRFIELFAGGGIVGLTVAHENLANQVLMVELDEDVSAVWKTILNGHGEWLARRICEFDVNVANVDAELANIPTSDHERAFQTILRNRVNHGGILAMGAGRIKVGENGKGLKSRWYPETLARRIKDIADFKERITFIHGDAFKVLAQHLDRPEVVYFVDPPYTASTKSAGTRLYRHTELDHEKLFDLLKRSAGNFLMTYDNDPLVRHLAEQHGFDTELVAMKNTHHAQMTELLIGRDLSWTRNR